MMRLTRESISGGRLRSPGIYIEHYQEPGGREFETGVPLFVGFGSVANSAADELLLNRSLDIPDAVCESSFSILRIDSVPDIVSNIIVKDGSYLVSAMRGFFANGGKRCVAAVIDNHAVSQLRQLFQSGGVLEQIEGVDLVCVPDSVHKSIAAIPELLTSLQTDILDYCERMGDRFAILDGPEKLLRTLAVEQEAVSNLSAISLPVSVHGAGAIYVPWVKPCISGNDASDPVPASGHVAGIYARVDSKAGPHQAPANEMLEGVVDLESEVSDDMQSVLNDLGVNCIRSLPGRGIRVWGARTLSDRQGWRHVNVKRLFLTLTRWLEVAMADLVLEPNTESLRAKIRMRVKGYCNELMNQGALAGRETSEAYVVKCDVENNPAEVRESGMVVAEIGLATVVPTEFIFIRVTQSANVTVVTPVFR